MTVGVKKCGKILENCDADLEIADIHDTGYYACICTFLNFMRLAIWSLKM